MPSTYVFSAIVRLFPVDSLGAHPAQPRSTMKRALSGLTFALVLGIAAGCATPAVEIDYCCVFPNQALFDLTQDLSVVFADAVAHQANLQILNQTRQTG